VKRRETTRVGERSETLRIVEGEENREGRRLCATSQRQHKPREKKEIKNQKN